MLVTATQAAKLKATSGWKPAREWFVKDLESRIDFSLPIHTTSSDDYRSGLPYQAKIGLQVLSNVKDTPEDIIAFQKLFYRKEMSVADANEKLYTTYVNAGGDKKATNQIDLAEAVRIAYENIKLRYPLFDGLLKAIYDIHNEYEDKAKLRSKRAAEDAVRYLNLYLADQALPINQRIAA